jgi:hypothetical protein
MAVRPIVRVRPNFFFTLSRSEISPHVIFMGGRNCPSGSISFFSAAPLMPT